MITESKVTEIFCIADDFCKEFEVEMTKKCPSQVHKAVILLIKYCKCEILSLTLWYQNTR